MKVLKFGAEWCSGCIVMKPRWKEIEKELDWLETEYFDFDDNKKLAEDYEIEELPAFIFLDSDGQEIERMVGEVPKKKIVEFLEANKDR